MAIENAQPAARKATDTQRKYAVERGLRAPFGALIGDPRWIQENFDG